MTVRELSRRAGISHTQLSRLEAGQVAKPSREVLVAISRALDRNPNPLLIIAGHLDDDAARESLRTLFREGSELGELWTDHPTISAERVHAIVRGAEGDRNDLAAIAAEVFRIAESDETLWDDSYALAAATGEHAERLREVMDIWRYIGADLRSRWLDYGRQLRRIADLEYLATNQSDQLEAELNREKLT